MHRVFPSLIPRAARVRAQCLELGGLNDYYTNSAPPSSSTLVAAVPSATNVYTLAFGEREGLAPGERLEVYGNTVRLVRTLAYGCPRGLTPESVFTGRLKDAELASITEQLNVLKRQTRRCDTIVRATQHSNGIDCGHSNVASAADEEPPCISDWMLRVPSVTNSRVLQNRVPGDAEACTDRALATQLRKLRASEEEVIVAEWVGKPKEKSEPTAGAAAKGDATPGSLGAGASSVSPPGTSGTLLIENGVCFRDPDSCGLRTLRTARLAFISSIEHTANGLAGRQRSQVGEEARSLAVLDATAIDFTFAQAALQCTLELGLHTGADCQISHVPLTDAAAARVEPQAASYIRVVASGPGRALPRPFDYLPTNSIDVGAYTAHLPLPVGPATGQDTGEGGDSARGNKSLASRRGRKLLGRDARADRRSIALQLAHALATLRRGACMLVTFVPTYTSMAALHYQTGTQRRAEVVIERSLMAEAKACIAEAISRTGRWGFITDEVLPAADSAQGSSFSLVVMLE
ncbi:hypothetical protein JKF63_05002 [Porcisia hertigi]|uniref:Uncharacterized protein n=1 Tax=Porcisia hertigi TaxID=2761500 RepID=A0A836IHJ7_9TRYP|nr:hypothetical protein JKF63_05002 [Porcisia hertigi]